MSPITRRRIEFLLPPTLIFFTVAIGVLISPYSHLIPGVGKPCGLREWTGWPCLACGGTRSVQALAEGDVMAALRFNPMVFLAISGVGVWFLISLSRVARISTQPQADGPRRKLRARWWLLGLAVVAVINWWYLVNYLPA